MKKITLVLFIIVISVFMSANVTLANGWKYFEGTYSMSASGSCIHSENGYVEGPFINAKSGVVYAGTTVSNGTWVFKKDGTGKYSYIMYATVTPPVEQPPEPCSIPGGIRIFSSFHKDADGYDVNEYAFTYELNNFGNITIHTEEKDTPEGSISIDKKAITLFDALRQKGPGADYCPWYTIICTATRTLIKVHD